MKLENIKKIVESCYLCIKYPFLYPRNRLTDKHYDSLVIRNYLYGKSDSLHNPNFGGIYNKAFTIELPKRKIKSLPWAIWFYVVKFVGDYIVPVFHCIPTFTELDAMPYGWRKAFGIQMCEDIKAQLKKEHCLYKYRIMQIKDKWGGLRWYDLGSSKEIQKIIAKYESLSFNTCIDCGKPATKISSGWISPYCDDCYDNHNIVKLEKINGKWVETKEYRDAINKIQNEMKKEEKERKKKKVIPNIQLYNRDGDKNYLKFAYTGRTKEHLLWYDLKLEHSGFSRTGFLSTKPKEYYFIDPSGGPFMQIDWFKIEGLILRKIIFKKGIGWRLGFSEE